MNPCCVPFRDSNAPEQCLATTRWSPIINLEKNSVSRRRWKPGEELGKSTGLSGDGLPVSYNTLTGRERLERDEKLSGCLGTHSGSPARDYR